LPVQSRAVGAPERPLVDCLSSPLCRLAPLRCACLLSRPVPAQLPFRFTTSAVPSSNQPAAASAALRRPGNRQHSPFLRERRIPFAACISSRDHPFDSGSFGPCPLAVGVDLDQPEHEFGSSVSVLAFLLLGKGLPPCIVYSRGTPNWEARTLTSARAELILMHEYQCFLNWLVCIDDAYLPFPCDCSFTSLISSWLLSVRIRAFLPREIRIFLIQKHALRWKHPSCIAYICVLSPLESIEQPIFTIQHSMLALLSQFCLYIVFVMFMVLYA
jgi:hypothetical protein